LVYLDGKNVRPVLRFVMYLSVLVRTIENRKKSCAIQINFLLWGNVRRTMWFKQE
jgi:hypothetical protein